MVMLQGGDCTSLRFGGKTYPGVIHYLLFSHFRRTHRYPQTERKGGRKTHQTTHSITDRKRMPAALVTTTTAKRGRRGNNREGRRGRPRKPNFLSLPPVSRRSSLRTPRRQHREDFYNVDEIVVDDEDDDYFEQEREEELDGEEEEEEDFRSKKKLKLLLKLHHIPATTPTKTKAKRRSGSYPFSSSDDDAADDNGDSANVEEDGTRHFDLSPRNTVSVKETPLPDSKTLIFILDKIQKKDKYGVFRDPVDLDELPDYHEIIDHPMDFSTIRKKLARNLYSNLEQFESDIFLLCSNAMQYNTPETIYFKQANSMQELARKRFQTIREESRCSETILNARETNHSKIIFERKMEDQPNKQANSIQELTRRKRFHTIRAGSKCTETILNAKATDHSKIIFEEKVEGQPHSPSEKSIGSQPDTVLNKPIEKKSMHSGSPKTQAKSEIDSTEVRNSEMVSPSKSENHSGLIASNSVAIDALPRKADEPSGLSEKLIFPNNGQKSFDEDRRATYITPNLQHQPPIHYDYSLFSNLESDKTLVAVGLLDESSYARSLARFSASLGSVAWKLASVQIAKAIPAGMRFGPGWVGEYEPLIPIFSCESYIHKSSSKNESSSNSRSCEELKIVSNEKEPLFALRKQSGIESGIFFHHQKHSNGEKIADFPTKEKTKTDGSSNVRALNNFHADIAPQQSYILDQTGANSFRMPCKENQLSLDVDSINSSVMKNYSFNKDTDIIAKVRGLPDGEDGTCSINPKANGSAGFGLVPFGTISQKEEDPAKLIRMLPCNNYQNSYYTNMKRFMVGGVAPRKNSDSPSGISSTHASWTPAITRSSTAQETSKALGNSEAQMRTHLSSSSKPTWMFPHSMPGIHDVDSRRAVIPQLSQKSSQMMSVKNFSTVSFPQIITNELSRLPQCQTWQGVVSHSHAQQKQSKNMGAPDLNFGFQSPGSPGQQSSGISQQPDLALQL